MKKVLVVLLAILVTGGLFAQITFTGDVKTGLRITQSDEDPDDKDPKVKLFHDGDGHRFSVSGAFDFNDDFGLSFGFIGKPSDDSDPQVAFDSAKLWGGFLDNKLKLTVATGTGAAWASGGKADKNFDDTSGIKLEVIPITGLDVGLQFRTVLPGAEYAMTAEQWLKEIRFGAKYEMADLFSAVVAFKLDSDYAGDVEWVYNDPDLTDDDPGDLVTKGDEGKQMGALLGFSLKLVPNLTAILDGYVEGLGDLELYGKAGIGQKVGYQITPELYAGVGVAEILDLTKHPDGYEGKTLRLVAEPEVTYKLSDLISLALNIPFAMGWSGGTEPDVAYDVGVTPKATFTLNDHASIETFYTLSLFKEDTDGVDAITKNKVQVNFSWSF
jgi:hypothetical protein